MYELFDQNYGIPNINERNLLTLLQKYNVNIMEAYQYFSL